MVHFQFNKESRYYVFNCIRTKLQELQDEVLLQWWVRRYPAFLWLTSVLLVQNELLLPVISN